MNLKFAANLVADGHATASITIHAPQSKAGFTTEERNLFQEVVEHLTRSVTILRRLQIARVALSQREAEFASGFAVVDRVGQVLHADEPTLTCLRDLGILQADRGMGRIAPGRIRALLDRAVSISEGGHVDLRDDRSQAVRLTVTPCTPNNRLDQFAIDRPAALVWVISLAQVQNEKMQRLAKSFGLTPAETKVAVEACAGGGRAGIAHRCGISSSTVRTHLESIYSKTGVHRHAELVNLATTI